MAAGQDGALLVASDLLAAVSRVPVLPRSPEGLIMDGSAHCPTAVRRPVFGFPFRIRSRA